MKTISQNKIRARAGRNSALKTKLRKSGSAAGLQNLEPGKSIEQLRLEAVARLREIGLFI